MNHRTGYESPAPFYDLIVGPHTWVAEWVLGQVEMYLPEVRSILELGCGTGSVIHAIASAGRRTEGGWRPVLELTGIDATPAMLSIASARVPEATLYLADMASFDLGRHFDVAICVLDTLNHLARFELWGATFDQVQRHLSEKGLFLFDVLTVGSVHRVAGRTWRFGVGGEGSQAIVEVRVTLEGGGSSRWEVEVDEGEGIICRKHSGLRSPKVICRHGASMPNYTGVVLKGLLTREFAKWSLMWSNFERVGRTL